MIKSLSTMEYGSGSNNSGNEHAAISGRVHLSTLSLNNSSSALECFSIDHQAASDDGPAAAGECKPSSSLANMLQLFHNLATSAVTRVTCKHPCLTGLDQVKSSAVDIERTELMSKTMT